MLRPRPLLLLAPVLLLQSGCPAKVHPYEVRPCHQDLVYLGGGAPKVAGEWNGFAPQPMEDLGDGRHRLRLELEPRSYAYELVDAGERLDPANPYTRWVGSKEYSRLTVDDCRRPVLELERFAATAGGEAELSARYVDGSQRVGPGEVTVLLGSALQEGAFDEKTGRISLRVQGLGQGKHQVVVRAKDADGRAAEELYLPFWVEPAPFDWQEAILYFAFTDRFRNGDPSNDAPVGGVHPQVDYRGGDFAGIRQALEEGYFDALGVRALWISPVDANPDGHFGGSHGQRYTGYHGYWPSLPRTTQPRFGSLQELQALTRAAHQRGIRVITDLVVNHLHQEHPYFVERREEGWFNVANACVCGSAGCDWEERKLDCWFTNYLPDLNWRNTALVDQMVDDALWWLKEAGFDGFRLDAVKHLDQVAGRTLAARVNEISSRTGTPFYLVGETFTGSEGRPQIAEYIGPSALHGQFDFPLYWPLVEAFGRGGSLLQVDEAVAANEAFYDPWTLNSPFLGNHDVARFISIAAGQVEGNPEAQAWGQNRPPETVTSDEPFRRLRDGLTFVLTLPGVPLLYYGDEVGLGGAGDPDNRRMMKWGNELSVREEALLAHVQKVGQARRHSRALRFGARYTLLAEKDALVYQREDALTGEGALVTVNRGDLPRSMVLPLRGKLAQVAAGSLREVTGAEVATVAQGQVTLTLPPHSSGVWVPAP